MKKLLGIIILVLLIIGNVNAKTFKEKNYIKKNTAQFENVKALIENVSINDVKSKLKDDALNNDFKIRDETSNRIAFIKKRKGKEAYDLDIFNLFKRDNGTVIYYKSIIWISDDEEYEMGLGAVINAFMQQWLDDFIENNF